MSETMEIIKKRQSCRGFQNKKVEDEKIVACINAATLAPSACNTQPYHFYVANTEDVVAKVAEYAKVGTINQWTDEVPAFVIITKEHADMPAGVGIAVHTDFREFDIGLAVENFCLAAEDMGLGTCILGGFNEEKLKESLRLPYSKKISLILAVGYPSDTTVRNKKRRDLMDTITYLK